MSLSTFVLCAACVLSADPAPAESKTDLHAQWRPAFDAAAAEYTLLPSAESKPLKLVEKPIYQWARSGPHDGNNGAIYVWTNQGCAEAVACFWRAPDGDGKVSIAHELHSLSPRVLVSQRDGLHDWKPTAGLLRRPVPDAAVPAATARARLQQMRAIGRIFAARSVSSGGERTELRLLPQPLYRYDSTSPDVIDGALFSFVCSVGTDPEVFLLLEAVKTKQGAQWHYAVARFSHLNLFVDFQEREVWQAVRSPQDTIAHSADYTYWLFHNPLEPEPIDRARRKRSR